MPIIARNEAPASGLDSIFGEDSYPDPSPPAYAPPRLPERSTSTEFGSRMEAQIGVDPEAVLQQYRDAAHKVADAGRRIAHLRAEMAQLSARHGGKGQVAHFEYERKAKLSEIQEGRRAELLRDGSKVVEGALDSYAHAHPAYLAFLEHARGERVRYEEMQARLSEAYADQELAKGIQAYLAARLDIIRASMFAYGQESRLQA